VHLVVPESAELDLPGGPDLSVVSAICRPEVLKLEYFVDERSCAEVECGGLSVHKAAHHDEPKNDLEHDEYVVDAVHRDLVRVLDWLNEGNDAEWNDEEDREDYKCD